MSYRYTIVYSADAEEMFAKVESLLELGWNIDYEPKQVGEVYWCKLFKEEPETVAQRNRGIRLSPVLSDDVRSSSF